MKKKKIILIGTDSTHCTAFTKVLKEMGNIWEIGWALRDLRSELPISTTRHNAIEETLSTELGVSVVDVLTDEMIQQSAGFIVTSVDAELHLSQFEQLAVYQKPVFIDKPLAYSLRNTKRIQQLAKAANCPFFSCSSLRYSSAVVECAKKIKQESNWLTQLKGPISFIEGVPGMYWYGIHLVELLLTLFPHSFQVEKIVMNEECQQLIYRQVQIEDWPSIIKLVNQVFQPMIPLEQSFPLLFHSSNGGYVAVTDSEEEAQTIVGFIGVYPETIQVDNRTFLGCRIGAVCIALEFQGAQVGSQLLALVKEELGSQGVDYLLISGQGKLYLRSGAIKFGKFYHYSFNQQLAASGWEEIKISELPDNLQTYRFIQQLQQQDKVYYQRSVFEWQSYIKAHSLANLAGGKQVILSAEKAEKKAVLIAFITSEPTPKCQVIEFFGAEQLLPALLNELLSKAESVDIWLSQKSHYLNSDSEHCEKAENAGTIYCFNSDVHSIPFPHTWDAGFV